MEPEEAGAVHPSRLEDVTRNRQQPSEKEDDAEAQLAPDDHGCHRPQGPARLAEPVLRQAPEAERTQQLVDEAVELEQLAEDDADHGDREHEGQEQRPAMEAPAAQPFEEQDREQQREGDEDRHREQEPCVVAERGAERGIGPGDAEVVGRPRALEAQ